MIKRSQVRVPAGAGIVFFYRVNFLCWLLVRCLFHPCVTAEAHIRSKSFRQKYRVYFLCWLLVRCLFHPCVNAVVHKRSKSFRQKCRQQLQLNTQAPYACGFKKSNNVSWCMVIWCTQNVHWESSSFRWHQPCNGRIPLLWIFFLKGTVYHNSHSLIQGYIWLQCSGSARKQRIALCSHHSRFKITLLYQRFCLSLICQTDIRGHAAPHHRHQRN